MKTENKQNQTSEENNCNQGNHYVINRRFDKRNAGLFAVTMLLCTGLIIAANYIFAIQTTNDIHKIISDIEYSKVGGEENYKLIREMQKDQMLKYVDEIKKSDPEYIEGLKRKFKTPEQLKNEMTLTDEEVNVLKNDTLIYGNTGAKLSIIEFSDFECSFCKDFHSSGVIGRILEKNKDNINYIYKNVPSSKHENSLELAKAGKCILAKTNGENYFNFINEVFKETSNKASTKESLDKVVSGLVEKSGIKQEDYKKCVALQDITDSVNKEKGQARYLGLKTTPGIVIVNSKSGKYFIYEGTIEESVLNTKIQELLK